jgi:hypothetical protein
MFNEVPNKLIAQEAAAIGPNPKEDWYDDTTGLPLTPSEKENIVKGWNNGSGRRLLKELETFLDTQPFGDHFSIDPLEDELFWRDGHEPLEEYVEADKKRDALITKYSLKNL